MAKKNNKIFDKSAHGQLKKAQRELHDLLPVIDDAEACGVECEAFRAVVDEVQKQLTALEQRFMTPIPK